MSDAAELWKTEYERMADRAATYAALIGRFCIEIKTATVYHTMDPASDQLADSIAALNRVAADATKMTHGSKE